MPFQSTLPPAERFRSYVDRSGDCWLWSGSRSRRGYGWFSVHSKTVTAHRFALEQAMGAPIPDGFFALHTCDNPACVRNDDTGIYEVNGKTFPRWGHLWLGTSADNSADMVAKARQALGERNGHYTHPERTARGDRNGQRTHPERTAHGERHYSRTHPELVPRGDRNGARRHPETRQGERNGQAVLTAVQVRAIRAALAQGASRPALAQQYGVSLTAIAFIAQRRTWKHLD